MGLIHESSGTLALGLTQAIGTAIQTATTPGSILHHLIDGTPKCLVMEWNGDPAQPHAPMDSRRGDGRVTLHRPGDPGYAMPFVHDSEDEGSDIRFGVPTWIINRHGLSADDGRDLRVIGVGKLSVVQQVLWAYIYEDGHFLADALIQMGEATPALPMEADMARAAMRANGGRMVAAKRATPEYGGELPLWT